MRYDYELVFVIAWTTTLTAAFLPLDVEVLRSSKVPISVAVVNGSLWRWDLLHRTPLGLLRSSRPLAMGNRTRFLDAEEAMQHLRGCESTEERA